MFCVAIYWFAQRQEIWVDETTQLSGITLKFGDMLRWLGGHDVGRFGVPGDRMPPGSYILDWIWLRSFGPSELGFRLFHASFLVAGVTVLVAVARRNLGLVGSFTTLMFLCLSPKLIETAVEIRAYPMFFAATCAQIAIFVRILSDQDAIDRKLLISFVLVSLISIYTHFYGVVSSSSFFLALGLAYIQNRRLLVEIVLAFVVTTAGSIGVLPFVFSAVAGSKPGIVVERATGLYQYPRYLLQLVGDSANVVSIQAAILFLGGAAVLCLTSAITATKRMLDGNAKPTDWLLIVIISGVSATLAASLLEKGFDPLKQSYSIWIFAPLALFAPSGIIAPHGILHWKGVYGIAFAATAMGAAVSTYGFLVHASEFIHGPGEFVDALYDRADPPKAVIYDSGAAWGWSYFPLVFLHRGAVAQFRPAEDGSELVRIATGASQAGGPQPILAAVEPYQSVVLVGVQLRTYHDIRQCEQGVCPQFQEGEVEAALEKTGRWSAVVVSRQFGLYDAQVKVLRRAD